MQVTGQPGRERRVFMSYARADKELVHRLQAGLQRLHYDVWFDQRLSVGQAWWSEILSNIRRCDAIVVAVSPALLESQASAAERRYARALGKALLPVCVRPIRTEFLPPDLAPLQMVDYCVPGPEAAFELAYALTNLPATPPLPDPLPQPPPIPASYLSDLSERVRSPTLTLDDQLAVVARLRAALEHQPDRDAAAELLVGMRQRPDLYHAPAREIDAALARAGRGPASQPPGHGQPQWQSEAPGWQRRPAQPHVPTQSQPHQSYQATRARVPSGQQTVPPAPRRPPARWALSIVAVCCSPLVGIIALIFSAQVGMKWTAGDSDGARKASQRAQVAGILGIVVGISALLLVVANSHT